MKKRKFGNTGLIVSEVGFGAWAIGGQFTAGKIPLGWGESDDYESVKSLQMAFDQGINFFDTADFYGLGHSEKLIGQTFGNSDKVIIATKVGHRLDENDNIMFDYSKEYILTACESSLKRLKRESIDYYQLHTARVSDLKSAGCLEAMEMLKDQGKIRYWGISLNTYHPFPEAEYALRHQLGSGFQFVLNIINQRALDIIQSAYKKGYGLIARMPFQFGLLTGKFSRDQSFKKTDHRHIRLKPEVLRRLLDQLEDVWPMAESYHITPAQFSLSYILSFPEISTVIPGMRSEEQVKINTSDLVQMKEADKNKLIDLYRRRFETVLDFMQLKESES